MADVSRVPEMNDRRSFLAMLLAATAWPGHGNAQPAPPQPAAPPEPPGQIQTPQPPAAVPPRPAEPGGAVPATTAPPVVQTTPPPAPPEQAKVVCQCAPSGPAKEEAWTGKDWASIFSGTGGVLAFFVGFAAIYWNYRSNVSTNMQRTNEAELKALEEKLNSFYGPFMQLSNTNKLIADELKSRNDNPEAMRILLLLLDSGWRSKLSPGDATLVDEIVGIDKKLLGLIQKNAGLISAEVQPYLYRAAAHFRMMLRAHEGKLDNEPSRYRAYVYPRQLDGVIDLEIRRLGERMALLRREPMKSHPPAPALSIPAELALPAWPPAPDRGPAGGDSLSVTSLR